MQGGEGIRSKPCSHLAHSPLPGPTLLCCGPGQVTRALSELPSVQLKIRYSIPASPREQGEPVSPATCRGQVLDGRGRCPPRPARPL